MRSSVECQVLCTSCASAAAAVAAETSGEADAAPLYARQSGAVDVAEAQSQLRTPEQKGRRFLELVVISVTVIVVAVPEGLPLVSLASAILGPQT